MNMQGKDPKKEEIVKRRHFTFRLNVFFFCIFVLFSILIVRLAILQFVQGEAFSAQKMQQMTASVPIPPVRGNIYDRNGFPIAQSLPTQSLYFRMEPGQDKDEVIDLARRLEEIFKTYGKPEAEPLTASKIVDLMDTGYDIKKESKVIIGYAFSPRRIKSDLSEKEIAYFTEHRDTFKSIEIVEESIREYDEKTIAVQLIGYLREYQGVQSNYNIEPADGETYLGSETVGYDGIEYMYQHELRGKNGLKTYPVNASGKIIPGPVTIDPPVKGSNLYLTLDKDVQLAAEQAIVNHLEFMKTDPTYRSVNKTGLNANSGYAVAMEVETGKVVAMASMPDYDPIVWRGGRISSEDLKEISLIYGNGTIKQNWANYQDDKERAKHPGSLVPLGSTMKPLTVLIGLKEGFMTPNQIYRDTGTFEFGRDGSSISNSNKTAYGSLNTEDALYRSSNTYMAAMVGQPLYNKYGREAIEVWDRYMKEFGLGVTTGSGLPYEIPGVLEYPNTDQTGSALASMVFASFGQGARYTPLQLVQYAGVLATDGKRMRPQFVERVESPDGTTERGFKPDVLNVVDDIPQEYWDVVRRGMVRVFKTGFDGVGYTVATKTGTSQQDVSGHTIENAVFIAYAPVEKPKLAIAVVVPEGGYGAWGAAPIARKIFDAYDQAIGLTDAGPKGPAPTPTPEASPAP